jgi:hypothetical protein
MEELQPNIPSSPEGATCSGVTFQNFPLLKTWVESFLSKQSLAFNAPRERYPTRKDAFNDLIRSVVEIARYCVLFGYYSSPESLASLSSITIHVLDDAIGPDGKPTTSEMLNTKEAVAVKAQCLLLLQCVCNVQVRHRMQLSLHHFKSRRGAALLARLRGSVPTESSVGTILDDLHVLEAIIERTNYTNAGGQFPLALIHASQTPHVPNMLRALQLLSRHFSAREELVLTIGRSQV